MDRAENYDTLDLAMARADHIRSILVQDGVSAIKSGGGRSMPDWFNAYVREPALLGLPLSFWVAAA